MADGPDGVLPQIPYGCSERRSAYPGGRAESHACGEVAWACPFRVLGAGKRFNRAGGRRRWENVPEHRSGETPRLWSGAREHRHAARGVPDVLPHAPLDEGWYWKGEFALGVHVPTVARWSGVAVLPGSLLAFESGC